MADTEHEGGLWFEDLPEGRNRTGASGRMWVVVVSVVCIAALAVPVGLALSASGPSAPLAKTASHVPHGVADQQVLAALSATTSSGSFNVSYEFDPATPPTVTTTTTTAAPVCHTVVNYAGGGLPSGSTGGGPSATPATTEVCSATAVGGSSIGETSPTTGTGTIDTDPFAMVAVSKVPGLGEITLRDNGTDVWEFGGADYGLSPGSSDNGPGSSLSGFASLVEGTLGERQGAIAMGGLSSPTGYLDLDQSMVSDANQTGTGTVDGVPVTIYTISIAPDQGENIPGLTSEEAKAISASDAILKQQGFMGTTVQVSIDPSGYIRQTRSVAHFEDGSTTSSEATFSDFGCAGTVLMPGQTGATAPPTGCASPDTGVAPTTTTTSSTAPPSTTTSSTTPPATTTTVTEPQSSTTSTSTTLPPTTTSTQSGAGPSG